VAALPESYREAVAAVDLAGLSYREAARALDTREGTIMSRLHRGRAQVAKALGYTS
jgi:RNA polymerase sigma-70 factor, ECF subfamily